MIDLEHQRQYLHAICLIGVATHVYRPQRSCSKVMFLHVSVILSTGGGGGVADPLPEFDYLRRNIVHKWWITFVVLEISLFSS